MERLSNIHKKDLTAEDFAIYPIWVWDDEQEGHHPLIGSGAFPDQFGTLFIKAAFKTANGKSLDGYLVGIQSFYAFCLFVGSQEHLINLNLSDLAEAEIKKLQAVLGGPVLPLKYEVKIAFENQPKITGTLTMS